MLVIYFLSIPAKLIFLIFVAPSLPLLIELFFLEIVTLYTTKLLKKIFIPAFLLFHTLQLVNVYSTGTFIDSLTFENLAEAGSLGAQTLVSYALIGLSYYSLFVPNLFVEPTRKNVSGITLFAFLLSECCCSFLPIHNFFISLESAYLSATFRPKLENNGEEFKKDWIVTQSNNLDNFPRAKGLNVIVIFAEGFSEEIVNQKITPNLWYFEKQGISFKNYFNHTAATFRGIRGQLISGYQKTGGTQGDNLGLAQISSAKVHQSYDERTESLPTILNTLGYRTVFVSPHSKNEHLAHLMNSIGFSEIFSSENYQPGRSSDLSDKEQYEQLWNIIEQKHNQSSPFFISAYILGTHHGLDSPDLKYGGGQNPYLNKFYNQDFWFGKFFKKFIASPISGNTLLIFTADHSTYPSPEYKETFSSKSNYFVNKIPFVIYYKKFPAETLDAHNRNSLCMAPTVLDLLGVTNGVSNHFLGTSLFSNEQNDFTSLSVYGSVFLTTRNGEVVPVDPQDKMFNSIYQKISRFYEYAG